MKIAAFVLFIILLPLVIFLHISRSRNLLGKWAETSGYKIVSAERRWLRRGPFFWFTSDSQVVFYVTVEDEQKNIRNGYVRIGGWFLGLFSDKTEVRWDD